MGFTYENRRLVERAASRIETHEMAIYLPTIRQALGEASSLLPILSQRRSIAAGGSEHVSPFGKASLLAALKLYVNFYP